MTNRLAQSMRAELIEHFRKMEELDALRALPPKEIHELARNPIRQMERLGTEFDSFWFVFGVIVLLTVAIFWK